MKLQPIDLAIIVAYFLAVILIGLRVSRRGSKDMDSYFLGGKSGTKPGRCFIPGAENVRPRAHRLYNKCAAQ